MTLPNYCTVAEVTETLVDVTIKASDLTSLASAVEKASRRIDMWTGRPDGAYAASTISTLYYDGGSGSAAQYPFGLPSMRKKRNTRIDGLTFRLDEMASVTEVAFSLDGRITDPSYYTVLDAAKDYFLEEYNAQAFNRPYTALVLNVQEGSYAVYPPFVKGIRIKGILGYSTQTPTQIKSVAISLAARYWKRGKEGYQSSMTRGSGDDKTTFFDKMDLDILTDIDYLRRQAI